MSTPASPHEDRQAGAGPDRDRRRAISLSQGAAWKALISQYIETMLPKGDPPCAAAMQIMSAGSFPSTLVSSAIKAKIGAAARQSPSARLKERARGPVAVTTLMAWFPS
ncbi:hypothetical protein FRZ61_31600 [Hypericibacter adhaerens]|uniref:Uncharacterized protein n=1 Tax=Hypericibacter adhaerens TaxID=2602016 RepID=A0A5J6N1Q3_9PROT|nr:hypothetical protein FRZ61_31600 [Hypericibacter adhaerens]